MNKFYKSCDTCGGDGFIEQPDTTDRGQDPECGECDGLGFVLTEEGLELKSFLIKIGVEFEK